MSDSVRPHRRQPTRLPVPGILQARTLEWGAIAFHIIKLEIDEVSRVLPLNLVWSPSTITLSFSESEGDGQD